MKSFLSSSALSKIGMALFFLCYLTPTEAQLPQNNSGGSNNSNLEAADGFWQASFNDGGHYMVRINSISSISKHEYTSNGTARVVEVTIGSLANVTARFYYYEPAANKIKLNAAQIAADRAKDVLQNTTSRVVNTVQVTKDYPSSTHAHTVEYAIQSEDTLNALYDNLTQSLRSSQASVWQEPSEN